MIIQDPTGLLQRIPELKPLCEDPGVRRAVERGDPFRLYRTLRWARWMGRLRSHREVIDILLRHRRLFARPLKSNPMLGTVNGFGASLLGSAEKDEQDGTCIATHCVVALFAIPLLPLGAYVVRPGPSGGAFNRSWTLFARVPLGPLPWLWSRALALGVMALVVLGAAQAFQDSRYQDVRLINGFPQPVSVELGGKKAVVPARGMTLLSQVPTGHQKGRAATQDGVEIDTVELEVTSGFDVLAWNVAGAAPVILETVVYGPDSKNNAPTGYEPQIYCGQKVLTLRDVDHVFSEPPSSLRLSESQRYATRSHVGILPQDLSGPPVCLSLFMAKDRYAEAVPLLELFARLAGWEREPATRAIAIALMHSPEEAVRLARLALAAHPEDAELHRVYQWVAERTGQHEALVKEYRTRAEAQPDSASAQYLSVRLQRGPEGAAAMEQLAQRFPQEPLILRAVIYNRFRIGDWKGTAKAWETLRGIDTEGAATTAEAEATALVAQGRRAEALAQLKKLFAEADPGSRAEAAEVYARVARGEKGADPEELIAEIEAEGGQQEAEPSKRWDLRARAGLITEDAPDMPMLRFMSSVGRDPKAAVDMAPQLKPALLRSLGGAGWALAYGEAVRTGATEPEQALAKAYLLEPHSLEVFRQFVRGESVSLEAAELTPEFRAAAYLVRSRNTALPAEERRRLVEQARRDDLIHSPVSEAIASWAP